MFEFKHTDKGMALMAVFISGVIKQGLSYAVATMDDVTIVTLTGGY